MQRAELRLAIDEYQLRSPDRAWLVPVRLADVELPRYPLGGGTFLDDLNWIDLFDDHWEPGSTRLIDQIRELLSPDEPPVPPPPSRPWWRKVPRIYALLGALALALTLLAWQAIDSDDDPTDRPLEDGRGTTGSTAPDVPCLTEDNRATVEPGPGDEPTRVGDVTFAVTPTRDPFIDMAGTLAGGLEPGQSFLVAKTADPDSHDPTPRRNPGSKSFYIETTTPVGPDGCWTYLDQHLAYDCAGGIRFIFFFGVGPTEVVESLAAESQANADDGLQRDQVLDDDVEILGFIEVPTAAHPDCIA